jgi:hypothetical protein
MIPRENRTSSENQPFMLLGSPSVEPIYAQTNIRTLRSEIMEHCLVIGEATFASAWEDASAKDNDRRCQVSLACQENCRARSRVLSSSASALRSRLTPEAVLADLLAKLETHANANPSCVTFAAEKRRLLGSNAAAAGAAIAGPALTPAQPRKRSVPDNALSVLMETQRLRMRGDKARAAATSIRVQMEELQRRLADELRPMRVALEQAEHDLEAVEEELNALKAAPGKQLRLEPQPLQPQDDAVEGEPSTSEREWSNWDLPEFRRQDRVWLSRSRQGPLGWVGGCRQDNREECHHQPEVPH